MVIKLVLIMSKNKSIKIDAAVQTVIRVHPNTLDINGFPYISSEKKLQTVLSEKPDDNKHFYSLLKFTPYSDIVENSMKIIDIPRKKKLQFHYLPSAKIDENIRDLVLADDDGVSYICAEILKRRKTGNKIHYHDQETQTDVLVHPHILEDTDVSTVSETKGTQTSNSK
ncbi:uncharacterized protein LOC130902677 [Diorhabda carinulata]|uniref:uncharacterized protein LOC130902677 n=1 Tax=Diorhabda carinulata TaxID=1163345 RepID=UPI0025A2C90E|nr:uncharacterized protein LOC130902677 [Diorhabda carinulata]